MGGAVSTGVNNDDLIDNLLEADYIKSSVVEHVFRAVDRGHYFLPEARGDAYKDVAWKSNHLHMSAPCIYTEVMEGLSLKEGLSFLNLGSGTGYLSTLVGLILGSNGLNHGIEIHEDVVQYAYKRLDEFRKQSGAIDEFDFCEPKFVVGNCLCLSANLKYDRIYCGAGCPVQYENYVKSMLEIGGILVMPLNDQLIQVKRMSETAYELNALLPVSFATLITPDSKSDVMELLSVEPLSLQNLCRAKVRNILRKNIEKDSPEAIKRPRHSKKPRMKERLLRRMTVPIFDDFDSSDEEEITYERHESLGRAIIMVHTQSGDDSSDSEDNRPQIPGDETDNSESYVTVHYDVHDEIEMDIAEPQADASNNNRAQLNNSCDSEVNNHLEETNTSENVNKEEPVPTHSRAAEEPNGIINLSNLDEAKEEVPFNVAKERQAILDMYTKSIASSNAPGTSNGSDSNKMSNRVKFDSGYGDEIEEKESNTRVKRAKGSSEFHNDPKWRRINCLDRTQSSDSDSEIMQEDEDEDSSNAEMQIMVPSPYTALMKNKIQELPLPHVLKKYLNYYRDF